MKPDVPPMWSADAVKQTQTTSFELSTGIGERVRAFEATAGKMLDDFARYVLWAGYRPDECAVIEHAIHNGSRRRVIVVCGRECFEVSMRMAMDPDRRHVLTMTATPRVIEWPPRRGMPSDEMMDLLTGTKS